MGNYWQAMSAPSPIQIHKADREDLRLTEKQVDEYYARGSDYFKVGVLDSGNNPKAYVDTGSLNMQYDPLVYDGTWESNHSVVMKIEQANAGPHTYTFKNVVMPGRYLEIAGIPQSNVVGNPGISLTTVFESTTSVIFQRYTKPHASDTFAYSFDTPAGTFFLKPEQVPVSPSGTKKMIMAVHDTAGPANYYYFTLHPTNYPNPSAQ